MNKKIFLLSILLSFWCLRASDDSSNTSSNTGTATTDSSNETDNNDNDASSAEENNNDADDDNDASPAEENNNDADDDNDTAKNNSSTKTDVSSAKADEDKKPESSNDKDDKTKEVLVLKVSPQSIAQVVKHFEIFHNYMWDIKNGTSAIEGLLLHHQAGEQNIAGVTKEDISAATKKGEVPKKFLDALNNRLEAMKALPTETVTLKGKKETKTVPFKDINLAIEACVKAHEKETHACAPSLRISKDTLEALNSANKKLNPKAVAFETTEDAMKAMVKMLQEKFVEEEKSKKTTTAASNTTTEATTTAKADKPNTPTAEKTSAPAESKPAESKPSKPSDATLSTSPAKSGTEKTVTAAA